MMLRSRKVLVTSPLFIKKRIGKKRKVYRTSLSEVHIEGRSTNKSDNSVLHCGTGLCHALTNCDCISAVVPSSSTAKHSTYSFAENTQTRKLSDSSSYTTSLSEQLSDCDEGTGVVQSSSVTDSLVENHVKGRPINKDVAVEIGDNSDISELETEADKPSSSPCSSPDADSSDIVVISDSPERGSIGNKTECCVGNKISQAPVSRKRKHSEESGVEFLYDISVSRPKKKQITEFDVKEKNLYTNMKNEEKYNATTTDRKVSPFTKNVDIKDIIHIGSEQNCADSAFTKNIERKDTIHITSERKCADSDDVILINVDDDEVSVINTKKECKHIEDDVIVVDSDPVQTLEDVIVLDSPPIQTPAQTAAKTHKRMVSVGTSVTGLIPHYSKDLIDYIPLEGKPATTTPKLPPVRNRNERNKPHNEFNIPIASRPRSPRALKYKQKSRAAFRRRSSDARYCDPDSRQSNCVIVPHIDTVLSALNDTKKSATIGTSQCVPPVPHLSQCVPPVSHSSQSVPPVSHLSQSVRPVSHSSQCVPSVSHFSQSAPPVSHSLQSAPSVSQCVPPVSHSSDSAPPVPQSPACAYGSNIYNPNANEKQESGLRPIIIDGNNIAMGHGKGLMFSWRGLHICIKYFLKRGHNVTAFVPTFRRGVCPPELRSELDQYERSGQVVFTPSRRIDGRLIVAYDDRFIVQCAAELGGVIVSTDNFRDLLNENSSWKETIEKRLLMFTWAGDLLMFPNDPLGRNGPKLEDFLRFPKK